MARSRSLKLPRRCLGSSGSSVGFTRCQSLIPPSSASSSIGVSKPSNCLQMSVGSLTVDLGQVSPKKARFPSIIGTQMGRNLWRPLSNLLQSTTVANSIAGCLCSPKTFKVLETSPEQRSPTTPVVCFRYRTTLLLKKFCSISNLNFLSCSLWLLSFMPQEYS